MSASKLKHVIKGHPEKTLALEWRHNGHQFTSLTTVYSTVYSGADQRKHQSSASLAFVWGIQWGPVNSPLKWPVTRKMFPFNDVIMYTRIYSWKEAVQLKRLRLPLLMHSWESPTRKVRGRKIQSSLEPEKLNATLPWSPLRYQYLTEGGNCVTMIAPKSYQELRYFCTSICCSFLKFYHRFGYHIETITNDRPIPSVKHMKHNAKSRNRGVNILAGCCHRHLGWMVTHSDLGNEFPFRYSDRTHIVLKYGIRMLANIRSVWKILYSDLAPYFFPNLTIRRLIGLLCTCSFFC